MDIYWLSESCPRICIHHFRPDGDHKVYRVQITNATNSSTIHPVQRGGYHETTPLEYQYIHRTGPHDYKVLPLYQQRENWGAYGLLRHPEPYEYRCGQHISGDRGGEVGSGRARWCYSPKIIHEPSQRSLLRQARP